MDALALPDDGSTAGGSSAVAADTDRHLHNIILDIVNSGKNYPQGSPEQRIRKFYKSVLMLEARNAAGIEPLQKYLNAIEPFYRADPSRSQQIPGSGLGLAVVRLIVEHHGGKSLTQALQATDQCLRFI